MFWLTKNLSASLSAMVVWGFLMALLFNILMNLTKQKKDNLLLFSSFVMFCSYFTSDHFYELFFQASTYLTWFVYDVVTLLVIFIFSYKFTNKISAGVIYTYIGLSINSLLFLAMYFDRFIFKNDVRWVLWDLYSAGVNIIDFIMIIGLIVNKDYLGIIRFSKYITTPIRKKALS